MDEPRVSPSFPEDAAKWYLYRVVVDGRGGGGRGGCVHLSKAKQAANMDSKDKRTDDC